MNTGLTADEVKLAYRLFFGREAESEQVVNAHVALGSLSALREAMMNSAEFQGTMIPLCFSKGSKWISVDVMDRFTQWIDLHDASVSYLCLHDAYEPSETTYFASRLSAGATVLDIGANIGWFTLTAAKHVGKNGRVHSFEPRPQTARMLKRTIADNDLQGQVTVWEYGVWDSWQRLQLTWSKSTTNPGGSSIASGAGPVPEQSEAATITVAPLDDLLPEIAPDLIKIDVEGAEPHALRGAAKALARKRPTLLSELHPIQLKKVSNASPAEYIDLMASMGYSCFLLEDSQPTRKLTDFPADMDADLVSVVFECTGTGK